VTHYADGRLPVLQTLTPGHRGWRRDVDMEHEVIAPSPPARGGFDFTMLGGVGEELCSAWRVGPSTYTPDSVLLRHESMRSGCVVIIALASALASDARAQESEPWRSEATLDRTTAPDAEENGPAHEPTRPKMDAEANREAVRAIAKPAWVPGARRSRPIMWAGLTLVAVAAAGGFAGAFAHGADNDDPIGMRIAFGSATLGSLAIPLVPLGAQRVGYPHRAPERERYSGCNARAP
jgi:hypothetical protein